MEYYQDLSVQLQGLQGRYDLDTVETEALTAWVSTVTESHSLSFSQAMPMLNSGLKTLQRTTPDSNVADLAIMAMLQAIPGVRYAPVIRKPGKPVRVSVFLGRIMPR